MKTDCGTAKIGFIFIFLHVFLIDHSEAYTKAIFEKICEDLIKYDVPAFMNNSVETFKHVCKSMIGAKELAYRSLYNDILASAFVNYNDGSTKFFTESKPSLDAKNNDTNFVIEFVVDRSAQDAFAKIEKYKFKYERQKRDILCVGVNFHYAKADNTTKVDTIQCDYIAKLYSDIGKEKQSFPHQKLVLDCP